MILFRSHANSQQGMTWGIVPNIRTFCELFESSLRLVKSFPTSAGPWLVSVQGLQVTTVQAISNSHIRARVRRKHGRLPPNGFIEGAQKPLLPFTRPPERTPDKALAFFGQVAERRLITASDRIRFRSRTNLRFPTRTFGQDSFLVAAAIAPGMSVLPVECRETAKGAWKPRAMPRNSCRNIFSMDAWINAPPFPTFPFS